ncbi:alpha-ketoglutarate-dependent dioxygenase AlkB family protein [Gayadomonas joobiniege]|uniref:alpha-ketoglutarate-dependent dioxygenase AlkB family protein n=1 Tax=Gayadomonas joobiniege TaxID=1234606 RepID=UPI00037EDE2E|nr:alpha-ketoglutarate-dependent dioxygenase AlkB [Gayadomonas joobiniege]
MGSVNKKVFELANSELTYFDNLFSQPVAQQWFVWLRDTLNWQQAELTVYGKKHKIPRLQALYADEPLQYGYSGQLFTAQVWPQGLAQLAELASDICQTRFNSVLANLYRDGRDSMGWHSDDERELGKRPVIVSFSFGAKRTFRLQHKLSKQQQDIELANGSCLVMAGDTQAFWQHCLPVRKRVTTSRINLTYRLMQSI